MYSIQPYTGAGLPSKHLCLTYDDGPGKDTLAIAEFLHTQHVQATFFVVGKYAFHHQDILEKIASLGHLIGNHTYEHPDMPYYLSVNGDIHNQVLRTDAVIRNYIKEKTVYFRSPYGKWSAEVANELNLNLLATINHIGPIHWDVGGVDCYHWKNGETVEYTAEKYLDDIRQKDHGIVVMHDEIADMDFLKVKNKTLELTKKLIPLLIEQGYKFVRLDEIETLQNKAAEQLKFRLRCTNGKYVALSSGSNTMSVEGTKNTTLSELSMEELSDSKIALRSSNGLFCSVQVNNGNIVEAVSTDIDAYETFHLIPFSANQVALRAYNGNYLCRENKRGGRLVATAPYMRGSEQFSFIPIGASENRKVSFSGKYKSMKRQLLYVKSKIQQRTQR